MKHNIYETTNYGKKLSFNVLNFKLYIPRKNV